MRQRKLAPFVVVVAYLSACGPVRRSDPVQDPEAAPPPVAGPVLLEEPARPVEDPPAVVRTFDDETEGLDLEPWEGSGPTESTGGGTIAMKGTLKRPFPGRRRAHRRLIAGRGRATQEAVLADLASLRARALAGGGWSAGGASGEAAERTAADVATTSLGVLACFSIGDAWSDRRHPASARDACRWLTAAWADRGNGLTPKDRPSHAPEDLHTQALLALALAEWRAETWVVYALDEGGLVVAALRARLRSAFPDGLAVASEEAATDAAWALLALHVARLAEFDVERGDAARIVAALERPCVGPSDERTECMRSVAHALGAAFHRVGATREDVRSALQPAIAHSVAHPEDFERASDRMFLLSVAVMQVGSVEARDWNRRVLRPLAGRPRSTDVRESALAAMCLSSYYRYSPAAAE